MARDVITTIRATIPTTITTIPTTATDRTTTVTSIDHIARPTTTMVVPVEVLATVDPVVTDTIARVADPVTVVPAEAQVMEVMGARVMEVMADMAVRVMAAPVVTVVGNRATQIAP